VLALDAVGRARTTEVVAAPEIVAKDMAHQKSMPEIEHEPSARAETKTQVI
jgi:hypothetical protein